MEELSEAELVVALRKSEERFNCQLREIKQSPSVSDARHEQIMEEMRGLFERLQQQIEEKLAAASMSLGSSTSSAPSKIGKPKVPSSVNTAEIVEDGDLDVDKIVINELQSICCTKMLEQEIDQLSIVGVEVTVKVVFTNDDHDITYAIDVGIDNSSDSTVAMKIEDMPLLIIFEQIMEIKRPLARPPEVCVPWSFKFDDYSEKTNTTTHTSHWDPFDEPNTMITLWRCLKADVDDCFYISITVEDNFNWDPGDNSNFCFAYWWYLKNKSITLSVLLPEDLLDVSVGYISCFTFNVVWMSKRVDLCRLCVVLLSVGRVMLIYARPLMNVLIHCHYNHHAGIKESSESAEKRRGMLLIMFNDKVKMRQDMLITNMSYVQASKFF